MAELHAATVLIRALGRILADAPPDASDLIRELAEAALALIDHPAGDTERLVVGNDQYLQIPDRQGLPPPPELIARLLRAADAAP